MSRKTAVRLVLIALIVGIAAFIPLPFNISTRVINSVEIAKPISAVFAYVTTPGQWPKWHPSSLKVSGATDHSLEVGERVVEDFRVAGRTGQAVWVVVDSAPPRLWVIDATISGRAAGPVQYSLGEKDGNTVFYREFTYRAPNLLFVMLNAISIRRQIQAESEQAVQNLKRVLGAAP